MVLVAGGGGGIPFCMPDTPPEQLGGGAFRIEPERIPALIAGLQNAVNTLRDLNVTATQALSLQPPGIDPYSADAMSNFAQTMQGGANAYVEAQQAYVQSLQHTIENLQKLQASTQSQEGSNASALNGTGS